MSPVFSVYQAVHQEEVQSDQHQRSGADCRDQCRQICLGDAQPEQRTVVVHGVERLDVAHGEKADAVDHYRKGHENGKAFPACEPEHSAVKHHKQRQNRINRHVKARKNNHRQNGHPLPPGMFFIGQEIEEQHHQHRQKSLSQRRLCHPDHHRRCRRRCTRKGCAAPAQLQIPAEEEHQENGAAVKYGLHILHLCHAEQLSPHRPAVTHTWGMPVIDAGNRADAQVIHRIRVCPAADVIAHQIGIHAVAEGLLLCLGKVYGIPGNPAGGR